LIIDIKLKLVDDTSLFKMFELGFLFSIHFTKSYLSISAKVIVFLIAWRLSMNLVSFLFSLIWSLFTLWCLLEQNLTLSLHLLEAFSFNLIKLLCNHVFKVILHRFKILRWYSTTSGFSFNKWWSTRCWNILYIYV